jgi:hypothetical protein
MFLAMVMEFQSRNNKQFVVHEVLQWGEVMQKMMKVDLSPYRDFADLIQNGVPNYTMVEKVRGNQSPHEKHSPFSAPALYNPNIIISQFRPVIPWRCCL